MTIWQMSLGASAIILATVVIRSLGLYKLPKNTFLILWGVALIRLLVPFHLSVMVPYYVPDVPAMAQLQDIFQSIENIPNRLTLVGNGGTDDLGNSTDGNNAGEDALAGTPSAPVGGTPHDAEAIPWLFWAWSGIAACLALYFILGHVHYRRKYRHAAPVDAREMNRWLEDNAPKWRKVAVKQTFGISAPLTYGLWRPVILIPTTINTEDWAQLQYILTHEMTHIRRFDVLWKFLAMLATCIHWFNPLVWVMWVLFNRDLEVTCDEIVVRKLGVTSKKHYALTLLSLAQEQSKWLSPGNAFSKKPLEERINAIMRYGKTSIGATLLAWVLVVGVFSACALNISAPDGGTSGALDGSMSADDASDSLSLYQCTADERDFTLSVPKSWDDIAVITTGTSEANPPDDGNYTLLFKLHEKLAHTENNQGYVWSLWLYTQEAFTDRFGDVALSETFGITSQIIGTDEHYVYVLEGPSDVQYLEEEQDSQVQYGQLQEESQGVLEGFLADNQITANAECPSSPYYVGSGASQ